MLVVINFNADSYNDLSCVIGVGPGAHWVFHPTIIDTITLPLPRTFGGAVGVVQEVVNGVMAPAKVANSVTGNGALVLQSVALEVDMTARVFVVPKATTTPL